MFKDWLPLLLVNLSSGLLILACGFLVGLTSRSEWRQLVSGFLLVGATLATGGGLIIFAWPLPGPLNIVWGVFFFSSGMLFLMAGLGLVFGWDSFPLGIPSILAGIVSILFGYRIIDLGLTLSPLAAGPGFITTGLVGILMGLGLIKPDLQNLKKLKITLLVLLVGSAILWLSLAFLDFWQFLIAFSDWKPQP
ncbi:MAG: DUF981 family protein [Chloroflexi bacterium]|nr:DUF981 family protein [Chloroflexota bacterium]